MKIPVVHAEVVDPICSADAERLDKRIRLLVQTIADNRTKLYELVGRAKHGEIHKALGYLSWTADVADIFTVQVRLDVISGGSWWVISPARACHSG
jgi:hypothetical protein